MLNITFRIMCVQKFNNNLLLNFHEDIVISHCTGILQLLNNSIFRKNFMQILNFTCIYRKNARSALMPNVQLIKLRVMNETEHDGEEFNYEITVNTLRIKNIKKHLI